MFKWRLIFFPALLIAFPQLSVGENAASSEHIVWDRSPIQVILPVGEERRIDFPVPINLDVPQEAVKLSKPIQVREDGSVYWTALQSFNTLRVQAITFTGYSYFLDVSAKKGASTHPIVILDDRVPDDEDKKADTKKRLSYEYDDADLIQYAAQNNYAPARLVKSMPGVTRIPVSPLACSEHLYRFHPLSYEPIAQWQSPAVPTRYVTAVRVHSQTANEIVFDPRLLRGDWIAASAQHTVLGPAGTDGDNTTWYLVSDRPFEEVCQQQAPYTNVLSRSYR
ncbi:MAG: TIGR03749 family integrating conjugative element protein [Candidatus Thiodiazotropha sp.]